MCSFVIAIVVGALYIPHVQLAGILFIHDNFVTFAEGISINFAILLVYLLQFIFPLVDRIQRIC